jgi:hypothetical protein
VDDPVPQAHGHWLLLIHQLPPKPDYLRVKVRRQLHRVGAVALKNSVYVLPNTDECTEDLQWILRHVEDEGGKATLCAASLVDGVTDAEVESMFRAQSEAEYGEIIAGARASAEQTATDVRRLRRELGEAVARDFFGADRANDAELAVRALEESLAGRGERTEAASGAGNRDVPRGATWVTRAGVQVDRIASAWLILRFIDAQARFGFVPAKGYEPEPGEVRFDMFEGEFTHEGDRCTFEVLVERFVSDDAALRAIAEIVHDIDCKDEKFSRAEAVGIARVIRGIGSVHDDDAARVEAGAGLFDGLYAAFRREGE